MDRYAIKHLQWYDNIRILIVVICVFIEKCLDLSYIYVTFHNKMKVKVIQSCLTLCNPVDCTAHLQARILEWGAIPFSGGYSKPRDWTQVSCIASGFFTSWATTEVVQLRDKLLKVVHIFQEHSKGCAYVSGERTEGEGEVVQSCLTLCNTVDCSLLGFSIHEILQARILEWFTISFSRGSSRPRDWTRVSRIGGRRFYLWATRETVGKSVLLKAS